MRLLIRLSLCGWLCMYLGQLSAQYISTEQVFPIEGYSVFEFGYPLKVAPGPAGRFSYLEYWAGEKQGRRTANHYLQSYGTRNYVEQWFKPVTNEGFESMRVDDLLRLEKAFAVIGRQYQEDDRLIHKVARFFDLEGVPIADEPTQISNYERKPKGGFRDTTVVSLRGRTMMWLGYDEKTVSATVWNGSGKQIWDKELTIPFWDEKYRLKEAQIDDEGNPCFLLEYGGIATYDKEPRPLILVKYRHATEAYQTEMIPVATIGKLKHAHFQLLRSGGAVVAGILAQTSGVGIRNGAKIGKEDEVEVWSELFVKQYEPSESNKDEWTQVVDAMQPMPENWAKKYQENGSNFGKSRLIMAEDQAILLFEEHYTSKKKLYYYDVACLGVRLSSGEVVWSQIMEKRQRDTNSDAFMSYVAGVARDKLRLVYLTERGAAGKLMCTSIELGNGRRKDKLLASNESAKYLFFPSRSGMVSNYEMVLIGRGNPSQNDYKLITISF